MASDNDIDSTPGAPARRNFLSMLLGGSLAAALLPAVYVAAEYLRPARRRPAVAVVGPETEIAPDSVRTIKVGGTDAVLLRDADGTMHAMSLRCTHAGCNVRWRQTEQKFHCPCHGGEFARDGQVLKGPPRRPLVQLRIEIENGSVRVIDES
jgi:cytochrome b6-f complex iron-sulfur subunit